MLVSRQIELDYGHTLPNHYSFCNQIHGHRATVIATFEGDVNTIKDDSSEGMVIDFKILKQLMMDEIHNRLDHGFAVWSEDTKDYDFIKKRNQKYLVTMNPPTAEYLARWSFMVLEKKLPLNIKLIKVIWKETPNSWAEYQR